LWQFFAAPPTLLALAVLLAMLLVLGSFIPQIPAEVADDPQAWLAAQPEAVSSSNGLVRTLGLFDLYHTFWFRLLLAFTGVALFVWLVDSAELAWRAARGQWTPAALALWGRHPLRVLLPSGHAPDDVHARLGSLLSIHRYRSAGVGGQSARNVVAGRRAGLWWAQPAGLAALLVALGGLAVMSTWGWQSQEWRPAVGDTHSIAHDTPYSVRLEALGTVCDVAWLENDQVVQEDQIGLGRPATRQGLVLRQVGTAPAVTIRGQDEAGRPLLFQSVEEPSSPAADITLAFPAAGSQHLVSVASRDLLLVFRLEAGSAAGSEARLSVALVNTTDGTQQTLGVLSRSGPFAVDGLQVEAQLAYRPVLRVDYWPGMGLAVAGLALGIVLLAAGWLAPGRLVWLAIEPGVECSSLVHVLAVGGAGQHRWFARLAAQMREVLADAS